MQKIFDYIDLQASTAPMHPAVISLDGGLSYRGLVDGIASVQAAIDKFAPDREAPVGILVDLPANYAVVSLALMKSGYTIMPFRDGLLDVAVGAGARTIITDRQIPMLPGVRNIKFDERWLQEPAPARQAVPMPGARIVAAVLTSGSTGRPKAIGFSAAALENRIFNFGQMWKHRYHRILSLRAIANSGFHYIRTFCLGDTIMHTRAESAQMSISFLAPQTLFASAAQIRGLLEFQKENAANLRMEDIEINGGQLPDETVAEVQRSFRANVYLSYGSTEASLTGVCHGALLSRRAALGNCYAPLVEVEIVSDGGEPLPAGREGIIRVRSNSMGWPLGASLIEDDGVKGDGWFYPGDVGFRSNDGLLVVAGRADDVINDGGVKYSPELVEDVLKRHPAIADAGVVRMTTGPMQTEAWLAIVAKRATSIEEINGWLPRELRGELRSVQLRRLFTVDQVPRTGTGKVARGELRALLARLAQPS